MDNNETVLEKHIVTQEDIDLNPDGGLVLGDEIELPAPTDLDMKASEIHAAALAVGKTHEEALVEVDAFYKSQPMDGENAVAGIIAEISVAEVKDMVGSTGEEAPKEPEAPVEGEKTVDQQVAEKLIPYVEGKLFEGKRLIAAEWSGEALIVRDENDVKYTLTGKELEKFLSY